MRSMSLSLNLGFVASLTIEIGSFYALSLGTLILGTQPSYCEEDHVALWRGFHEETQAKRDGTNNVQFFFLILFFFQFDNLNFISSF